MQSLAFFFVVQTAGLVMAYKFGTGFVGPGRMNRVLEKREGRDFGKFTPDCANAAAACNNACYYIHCNAFGDPNASRVIYIGPDGEDNGETDRNRIESGCDFNYPPGDICQNFPFSQKLAQDPAALDWQCDEWPPASSQQVDFNNKQYKNSLRCMPGLENASLGAQLANFYNDQGGPYPERAIPGSMSTGDYFEIDFSLNTGNSSFCNQITPGEYNCANDGFQFGMTSKSIPYGGIGVPYHIFGNDNRYATQNTAYADVLQCRIKFSRDGDSQIKTVILTDADNIDTPAPDCTINNDGDTCVFPGLTNEVKLTRTGVWGQPFNFEYSSSPNVNYFAWNSESRGAGFGPATIDGDPTAWCRVLYEMNIETTECWFPCYRTADGRQEAQLQPSIVFGVSQTAY